MEILPNGSMIDKITTFTMNTSKVMRWQEKRQVYTSENMPEDN